MKMKFGQALQILEQAKQNDFLNWNIPGGLALQVARIIEKLEREAAIFEKQRHNVLKQYSELDKDGNIVSEDGRAKLTDEQGFATEYQEMLDEEVDLDVSPIKVNYDELDKRLSKSPREMAFLIPFLDQE